MNKKKCLWIIIHEVLYLDGKISTVIVRCGNSFVRLHVVNFIELLHDGRMRVNNDFETGPRSDKIQQYDMWFEFKSRTK